jgi:tetratricopeptide (TPR) repeat protein
VISASIRLLGLHQALWRFDRWYRYSWIAGPQALSILTLILLFARGGAYDSASAPWAKRVSAQANPEYQLCANINADYRERGAACDRLIASGTLSGAELSTAYFGRGWQRYKENQLELAIADQTEAIKHNPDNAEARENRGALLAGKNQLADALADFNEAIRTQPKWVHLRASRAEVLRRQGKLADALGEVNSSLALQDTAYGRSIRDSIQADMTKQTSGSRTGSPEYQLCANINADYRERGAACDRLIASGTLSGAELSTAHFGRGWQRQNENQLELAMADHTEAIKHDPDNAAAHQNRGALLAYKNQLADALADFDEAIRIQPKWVHPRASRADVLRRQGKLSEALGEVNYALTLQDIAYGRSVRDSIQADMAKQTSESRTGSTVENSGLGDCRMPVGKEQAKAAITGCDAALAAGRLDKKAEGTAHFFKGLAYRLEEEPAKEQAQYSEALGADPTNLGARFYRGLNALARNDLDSAIADFNEVLKQHSDESLTYYQRGRAFALKGEKERAIEDFNAVIRLDPALGTPYLERGLLYLKNRETSKAVEDFSAAIKKNDGSKLDALTNRAYMYFQQGQYERALADLNEALKIKPGFPWVYRLMANAYYKKGDFGEAVEHASKAIELDPNEAEGYLVRGALYLQQQRYEQAKADFKKIQALRPDSPEGFYDAGLTAKREDDEVTALCAEKPQKTGNKMIFGGNPKCFSLKYQTALSEFSEAIKRDPTHVNAYYERGNTYNELKRFDEAISDFSAVIRLLPSSANAFNQRAVAHLGKGELDAAISDCSAAIAVDNSLVTAYNNCGVAFARKGNRTDAVRAFRKASALDPKNAFAQQALSSLGAR